MNHSGKLCMLHNYFQARNVRYTGHLEGTFFWEKKEYDLVVGLNIFLVPVVQFDVLDLPKANNSFFFVGVFVVAGGLFTAPRSLGHANVHIKVTTTMQFSYTVKLQAVD